MEEHFRKEYSDLLFILFPQHSVLEPEANQIRASILDMAHCIRTFTEEISDYSRKLVGIVQQIEGGEQIIEDGVGMAHTEHVSNLVISPTYTLFFFVLTSTFSLLVLLFKVFVPSPSSDKALRAISITSNNERSLRKKSLVQEKRGGQIISCLLLFFSFSSYPQDSWYF